MDLKFLFPALDETQRSLKPRKNRTQRPLEASVHWEWWPSTPSDRWNRILPLRNDAEHQQWQNLTHHFPPMATTPNGASPPRIGFRCSTTSRRSSTPFARGLSAIFFTMMYDLYKRVMLAIKSKGRMDGGVIEEALKTYAMRWLPDSVDALVSKVHIHRNKSLVETIICLLPSDKAGISCAYKASVNDLLIPARPPQTTVNDIELVQRLVAIFVANEMSKKDLKIIEKNGKNDNDFVLGHGSWLKVGKIIDGYLSAVARDRNLPVSSFIKLSQSIPEMARPIHDGLYGAIDIFLMEHSALTKSEKKNLCGLMDVKKLTTDASMHATQNEQLPLRVVVQVLFFEQARAAAFNNGHDAMDPPTKTKENWGKTMPENHKSLRKHVWARKHVSVAGVPEFNFSAPIALHRAPVFSNPSKSRVQRSDFILYILNVILRTLGIHGLLEPSCYNFMAQKWMTGRQRYDGSVIQSTGVLDSSQLEFKSITPTLGLNAGVVEACNSWRLHT
ncbi:hypothetical protein C2S52_008288 [Perilla frutescens var. hirtella]|nr:hypothetical protein C2S52_008288 [Perilla frutescens var. hirtella]